MPDSLWPQELVSPGQNTEVGSLSLLPGIFPTQGLNPGLLHCRWILYQLSHKGSPLNPTGQGKHKYCGLSSCSWLQGFFHKWESTFFFLKGKKLFLSVQRQSKVYLSSKMKLGNTSKKKIIYSVKIKKEWGMYMYTEQDTVVKKV